MDFRIYLLCIGIIVSGCQLFGDCEPDEYGEEMTLVVPIHTYPVKDTFQLGDTLWIEADFSKNIEVVGHNNRIRLDNFNFFIEILLSEISNSELNFAVNIEVINRIGEIRYLPLSTVVAYPLILQEEDENYTFSCGIILNSRGRFLFVFDSPPYLFEEYEHPAMYTCKDRRRDKIEVQHNNDASSREAYEELYETSAVAKNPVYKEFDFTYEGHKNSGGIVFIVE